MPNIVYIATSLDGFIARKDGNIDWLSEYPNPDNSDYGFGSFMGRLDGIIMGRKTFETLAGFGEWPYTKPVFVLSSKLTRLPGEFQQKAQIVRGEPKDIIASLYETGIRNIYVDGGKTIQGFLREDLIDEMIITRIPIILGSGIPLFTEMDKELKFKVLQTEMLNPYLQQTTYLRIHDQ